MKLVSPGATVTVLCLWGAIGLLASPLSAGDSGEQKPLAEQTYTITQLDTGANVASSAHLISDNGVVAGNLQERFGVSASSGARRPASSCPRSGAPRALSPASA